jgi:hypothetical protein
LGAGVSRQGQSGSRQLKSVLLPLMKQQNTEDNLPGKGHGEISFIAHEIAKRLKE